MGPSAVCLCCSCFFFLLSSSSGNDIAIVDRFSGRILEGRKYSDGLQQSIQVGGREAALPLG